MSINISQKLIFQTITQVFVFLTSFDANFKGNFKSKSKGVHALRGYFGPFLSQKLKVVFHQLHLIGLLEDEPNCKILAFILLLPVAMVTKMADKIGLKSRNCHFRPNLRLLETDFLRIRYQHKQIPKKSFNILCAVIILIIG